MDDPAGLESKPRRPVDKVAMGLGITLVALVAAALYFTPKFVDDGRPREFRAWPPRWGRCATRPPADRLSLLDFAAFAQKLSAWVVGASGLALASYFMSLTLLSAYMAAQLPYGWAYVAPTLLGVFVVSQATKWNLPGGVIAAVVAAAIGHAHLLATAVLRPDGPDGLVPLLVFVVATLALERLVTTRITEKWDHEMRRHAMLLLVVLSTTTAMAAVYHSELLGSTWATAGWSVVGGAMMAAGFTLKSAVHRRVALAVLGLCVVRVFVVDTVGLSDTARIGAFLVLGLILVGIALLYTKFSEELKSWL